MIRWILLLPWLASTLPAVGMMALLHQSNQRKAAFCRAATDRARGTILRIEREQGSRLRLAPIVSFRAANGLETEFRSRYYDTHPPYQYSVGKVVSVVYIPMQPERAEIDEPSLWQQDGEDLRTAGFIWCGAMTCLFAVLGLWLGRDAVPPVA